MYGVVVSGLIFYLTRIFAGPPPKTMTREWQEATNEYLKARLNQPLLLANFNTNAPTERKDRTHHRSQLRRIRRTRYDSKQALRQEARRFGGRGVDILPTARPLYKVFLLLFAISSASCEKSIALVGENDWEKKWRWLAVRPLCTEACHCTNFRKGKFKFFCGTIHISL
jgi:hypothetical protein